MTFLWKKYVHQNVRKNIWNAHQHAKDLNAYPTVTENLLLVLTVSCSLNSAINLHYYINKKINQNVKRVHVIPTVLMVAKDVEIRFVFVM